jgi:cysteinyl-tRNA synthetase
LNTPAALEHLHARARQIQIDLMSDQRGNRIKRPQNRWLLEHMGFQLGLLQQDPEDWFKWQPASSGDGLTDDEIEAKITARAEARANKDFAASDAIRDELQAAGIILEDAAGQTNWRRG